LAWIVISILSIAAALNMLINPGPFGSQLPAVLSQFVAGAFSFRLVDHAGTPARVGIWGLVRWRCNRSSDWRHSCLPVERGEQKTWEDPMNRMAVAFTVLLLCGIVAGCARNAPPVISAEI
jgi:hypothetical protein